MEDTELIVFGGRHCGKEEAQRVEEKRMSKLIDELAEFVKRTNCLFDELSRLAFTIIVKERLFGMFDTLGEDHSRPYKNGRGQKKRQYTSGFL